jgi:hypothetical protein
VPEVWHEDLCRYVRNNEEANIHLLLEKNNEGLWATQEVQRIMSKRNEELKGLDDNFYILVSIIVKAGGQRMNVNVPNEKTSAVVSLGTTTEEILKYVKEMKETYGAVEMEVSIPSGDKRAVGFMGAHWHSNGKIMYAGNPKDERYPNIKTRS